MKKVIFLTFFSIFLVSYQLSRYFYKYFNKPIIIENTYFIINKGDTFKKIINNLNKKNLLNNNYNQIYFYIAKVYFKNNFNIKAGEYLFQKDYSLIDIIKTIRSGKIFYRKITIAEGLSNHSILKIIDNAYGLIGELPTYEIMEGTLLPETYLYTYGDTKESLIKRMQKDMIDYVDKEWEKRAKNLPFKTKDEVLSLASIIEKETGIPEERKTIASVFINRLKKNMKLQSDPTVIYAFTKGNKELEREIRRSDLNAENEYNTYYIYGIPKKPICNPGKDAIKATLNPDKTDYLYFVAKGGNEKGHNFSSNLEQHNNFVKIYRKNITNK